MTYTMAKTTELIRWAQICVPLTPEHDNVFLKQHKVSKSL